MSLALVTFAAAFPLLAEYLQVRGVADLNDRAGGPVGWAVGFVKGFLPGIAEPWIAAVVRNPVVAVLVIVFLLASLRFSNRLQGRICDRARAAWNCDAARAARNVGRRADATQVDRLRLTGQRQALAVTTLVFVALAIAAKSLSINRGSGGPRPPAPSSSRCCGRGGCSTRPGTSILRSRVSCSALRAPRAPARGRSPRIDTWREPCCPPFFCSQAGSRCSPSGTARRSTS